MPMVGSFPTEGLMLKTPQKAAGMEVDPLAASKSEGSNEEAAQTHRYPWRIQVHTLLVLESRLLLSLSLAWLDRVRLYPRVGKPTSRASAG